MKTFKEFLDKMGYGWYDFDHTYEIENLIEQYADERVTQALTIHDDVVSEEREKLCDKPNCEVLKNKSEGEVLK